MSGKFSRPNATNRKTSQSARLAACANGATKAGVNSRRGLPPSAGATRKSCDSRPRTKVARSACLERETYHAMLSCGWAASLCVHPSGPPMFPSLAHTFLREKRPGGTGPGFNGSAACGPMCASRQQLYRQIEYMCSQDRLLMFVSSGSGGSRVKPIAFTHAYNSFTKRTCASRLARRISIFFFF